MTKVGQKFRLSGGGASARIYREEGAPVLPPT
jgi:hypothetical protein